MSKPVEAPAKAPDNLNRTELYNGMSSGAGKNPGMGPGGDGGAGQGGGDKATHIDFAAAGDIYGGKAAQNGMGPGNKPDVQQAGFSSTQRDGGGNQGDSQPGGAKPGGSKPDDGKSVDRFGQSHEKQQSDKDGVVHPNVNEKGPQQTDDEMMRQKGNAGRNPQPDGGMTDYNKPKQTNDSSSQPADQVTASKQDGKVNEVSSFDPNTNKLTQYNLDGQGQVAGRTTTDLNDGSKDSAKYGDTGHETSHQVQQPGQAPKDAPLDDKDTAYSIKNPDGSLKSIDTTGQDGTNSIKFGDGGQPTSVDKTQVSPDGSSKSVHENLDGTGKAEFSQTQSYDSDGKLRTDTTQNKQSTDTKSYDDNNKVVQDNYKDSSQSRQTNYLSDRTETTTDYANGRQVASVNKNDGSSATMVKDPADGGTTTFTAKTADGSSVKEIDAHHYTQEQVYNGKTGEFTLSTTNKGGGVSKKSYGAGADTYGEFSETPI
jgi:hypothetical protein